VPSQEFEVGSYQFVMTDAATNKSLALMNKSALAFWLFEHRPRRNN
jgi:hypothetical protein